MCPTLKLRPQNYTFYVADLEAWKPVCDWFVCFCHFRGRCAELIGYWKYINHDVTKMANCYYEFIKMMENGKHFFSAFEVVNTCKFSNEMFQILSISIIYIKFFSRV